MNWKWIEIEVEKTNLGTVPTVHNKQSADITHASDAFVHEKYINISSHGRLSIHVIFHQQSLSNIQEIHLKFCYKNNEKELSPIVSCNRIQSQPPIYNS